MPDVFDRIAPAAPAAGGDVFDRIAPAPAPAPPADVFDRVAPAAPTPEPTPAPAAAPAAPDVFDRVASRPPSPAEYASPGWQASNLVGPLQPYAQELRNEEQRTIADPRETAAIAQRAAADQSVAKWFDRNADLADYRPGQPDPLRDRVAADPFPKDELRLLDPQQAAGWQRRLHEDVARPRIQAGQQLPEGWHVPEHLAATWRAEVPAVAQAAGAAAAERGVDVLGGFRAVPGVNYVAGKLLQARTALRGASGENLAQARAIKQGLPQTPAAQFVTGQANMLGQMGAAAAATGLTGNPAVGAAAFSGLFAADAASQAYANAKQQGRGESDALEDAAFSGVKAAIVARIPMTWPALAREAAATRMAGAYLAGTAITTGDAAVDQAALERVGEAFLTGGLPAAAIHGAHEGVHALKEAAAAPTVRTAEPPLPARPEGTPEPQAKVGDYYPGNPQTSPGELDAQPIGTLRRLARSRQIDYRLPREELIAALRTDGTPDAETPATTGKPTENIPEINTERSREQAAAVEPPAVTDENAREQPPEQTEPPAEAPETAKTPAPPPAQPPAADEGTPAAAGGEGGGDLYDQAVAHAREAGRASVSLLQRKMNIGYGKAAGLIERMDADGLLDTYEQGKGRQFRTVKPAEGDSETPQNGGLNTPKTRVSTGQNVHEQPIPNGRLNESTLAEDHPLGERVKPAAEAPDALPPAEQAAQSETAPGAKSGQAAPAAAAAGLKVGDKITLPPFTGAPGEGRNYGTIQGAEVRRVTPKYVVVRRTNAPADAAMFGPHSDVRLPREVADEAKVEGTAPEVPPAPLGQSDSTLSKSPSEPRQVVNDILTPAAPAAGPQAVHGGELPGTPSEPQQVPEPKAEPVRAVADGPQRADDAAGDGHAQDVVVGAGQAGGSLPAPAAEGRAEAARFESPPPESTKTIAVQKKELGEQLRHIVATSAEYHDDLLHGRSRTNPGESNRRRGFQKSATVGQRVAHGSLEPKALVDLDAAKRLARQLPPEHPAHRALKKLEALEENPQKRGVPETPPTSIKNEVVAQERAKREMPAAEQAAARGFGEVWEQAGRDLQENPDLADHLVDTLREAPRALTDHEDALLLHRQIELQNQYRDLTDRIIASHDAGGDETAELNARLAGVSDKLLELYDAGKAAGTETGRGLNARKLMAAQDYSLASMETQKRAANAGRPLTPAEHEQVRTLHEKVAKTQKAFDDYVIEAEARAAELQSRVAHARMRSAAAKPAAAGEAATASPEMKPAPRARVLDRLIGAGDAARDRIFKKYGGRLNSVAIDPRDLPDLAIVGAGELARLIKATGDAARALRDQWRAVMERLVGDGVRPHLDDVWERVGVIHADVQKDKRQRIVEGIKAKAAEGATGPALGRYVQALARDFVARGVSDREKLIDAVHGELKDVLPDLTRRQAMDAISGYGDFKQLSKDEVSAKLRDLKGQMQQLGKLQDMTELGQAPLKTGVERRTPSDEERRLLKEVNAAKKSLNIQTVDPETQLKSALDGVKTRLKNQISDLEFQVTTGRKIERAKTPGPRDAETADLEARRDELRKQYDAIFGAPELSDEQRLKLATAAVERSIEDYDRRLADAKQGKFDAPAGPDPVASPELDALRARRDAMREELATLRDAQGTSEEERIRSLEKSLAEYERRVKEGDVAPKGREQTVDTQAVADLRARRDAVRAQLDEMRKAARPPGKTPEEVALQAFKTRTANRIADLADRMAREDYAPAEPRPPVELDEAGLRLKAENERMKEEFQRSLLRDRLRRRTLAEKAQDTFVKWRRGFLLSSPVTLAKLTSAAAERTVFTPIEELWGGVISKVLPGLAARAPREGRFSVRAEARAITQGFTKGMRDAWDLLRTGKSDLDLVHGHRVDDGLPPQAIDFFGHVHGALKSTTKRNEFARSFQKRVEHAIANGVDPTDPAVQVRIAKDAYVDANRSIFMSDNKVVSAYRRMLNALKEPDKQTGRTRAGPKALATALETLVPIVKVPTNIVAETFQYALGVVPGAARLAGAYARGIKTLPEHEADAIMRLLKKGSIGAAVMALGYFGAGSVGGYYQHGEKRDEKDVPVGGVRVFGRDVPRYLVHNPLLEALQIGATIRRVADARHKKSDPETQGVSAGAAAAAWGLVEEVPFVRTAVDLGKAAASPRDRDQILGRTARSIVVPAAAEFAARHLDDTDAEGNPVKRKPEGVLQNVEMGIPGLRGRVPLKEEKPAPDPRIQDKTQSDRALHESLPKEVTALAAEHSRLERIPKGQRTRDERVRLYKLGPFIGYYEAQLKRLRLAKERGDTALEQRARENLLARAKAFAKEP